MEFRDPGISICELHCTNPSASFRQTLATLGRIEEECALKTARLESRPLLPLRVTPTG